MHALQRVVTLASLLLLVGCGGSSGPERYEVNGTVSIDDEPLPAANIQFIPQTDDIANAPTAVGYVKDGSFRIVSTVGPIAGIQDVEILLSKPSGVETNDEGEEVETEVLSGVIRTEVTVEANGENEFELKFSSSEIEAVADE